MPDDAKPSSNLAATKSAENPESLKETLISIVIAFTMAFVFRGFVIEAFVIPTGSMAPTLLGAHMKFRGSETGVDWAVNPWDQIASAEYQNPQDGRSLTGRNAPAPGITVHDPVSGDAVHKPQARLFSGDRILVLKYLYTLLDPRRYDVVVFKDPTDPSRNYIKRLIGLPTEEIALVDGDVFTRRGGAPATSGQSAWEQPGWTIARKPALQQRVTWQTVFDSSKAPLTASADRTPWKPAGESAPFTLEGRTYTFAGGSGELLFDQSRVRFSTPNARPIPRSKSWAIDDYYAYDEHPGADDGLPMFQRIYRWYPVSDVRVRLAVTPESADKDTAVTMKLAARGHDFEMSVGGGKAEIRVRPIVGAGGVKGAWTTAASSACAALPAGEPTNLEFWHSDQALGIWINGREVARHEYNWSPGERLQFSTGTVFTELLSSADSFGAIPSLTDPARYVRPEVRLAIAGPKCTLHRVGLDRDLHYQPGMLPGKSGPAHGTSPLVPLMLGKDEFFCCGDNSPASSDGRLWTTVDPWVDYEFRPSATTPIKPGIVPRELMLGRAFFVYLPSIRYDSKPPVPDFGRMRFIW